MEDLFHVFNTHFHFSYPNNHQNFKITHLIFSFIFLTEMIIKHLQMEGLVWDTEIISNTI